MDFVLILNSEYNPIYRHFCKCLYIEMLKKYLFINYFIHFTRKCFRLHSA